MQPRRSFKRHLYFVTLTLLFPLGAAWSQDAKPAEGASDLAELRNQVESLTAELEGARQKYVESLAQSQGSPTAFFTEQVQPIFETKCQECHGEKRQRGGLRLDSRAAFYSGGEEGAIVVPGPPDETRIIKAVTREEPFKKHANEILDRLSVDILTEWVRLGTPWPEEQAYGVNERELVPAKEVPQVIREIDPGEPVSFALEILPLLSDRCYSCHGADAGFRRAGVGLDKLKTATSTLPSGRVAIVPGDLLRSQVFQRVAAEDPNDAMPPVWLQRPLDEDQIELIGRWIVQGAKWEEHWAFEPPKRSAPPKTKQAERARNAIDHFVQAKLEPEGLSLSPEADRRTFLRRVTFDLTGLPPTLDEIDAFLADDKPGADDRVVDGLLASPRYGEHMARYWLDAARYSDTNGYHIDNERFMWRWRDWVIDSFNNNKPFDEFTVEQLAGDLLPDPTLEQRIASGFNRNHMINFEGGAIPEEYRTQYVMDRVTTTSTVWLGLTALCSQCHDHKFDPLTRREFYEFAAFFNTVAEVGLDGHSGNAAPMIKAPMPEQAIRRDELQAELARLDEQRWRSVPELDDGQAEWEKRWGDRLARRWSPLEVSEVRSTRGTALSVQDDQSVLAGEEALSQDVYEVTGVTGLSEIRAFRVEALIDPEHPEMGPGHAQDGGFALTHIKASIIDPSEPDSPKRVRFVRAYAAHEYKDTAPSAAIDNDQKSGWSPEPDRRKDAVAAVFVLEQPVRIPEGGHIKVVLAQESETENATLRRCRVSVSDDPGLTPSTFKAWHMSGPYVAKKKEQTLKKVFPPERKIDLDDAYRDGQRKWTKAEPSFPDGKKNKLGDGIGSIYLYREIETPSDRTLTLSVGSSDGLKLWVNGELAHENDTKPESDKDRDRIDVSLSAGTNRILLKVANESGEADFYFKPESEYSGDVPLNLQVLLGKSSEQRDDRDSRAIQECYRSQYSTEWNDLQSLIAEKRDAIEKLQKEMPTSMVMGRQETPRQTFMLDRGIYDQPGDRVRPGTPAFLPPMPKGVPKNRLGMAQWLTDPANPLPARVTVNRFWQQLFGHGLVRTVEDFGAQGEAPSHPALLDWLAVEFVESGWDVKALMRLLVTSATYRQDSRASADVLDKDPENRLYARGPRFRLDAETVRDNALAISGLLVNRVGGRSVSPYQPPGLWKEVAYGANFSAQVFEQGTGEDLYRRSMYTFWKRTSPPPSMMVFDAPNREICTVRRARSNTPLQALVLMNDPQFVEASRVFAERIMLEGGETPDERLAFAFNVATARPPQPEEVSILVELYESQRSRFQKDEDAARALVGVGDSKYDSGLSVAELAAWTSVANTILILDETITKS